MVYSKVVEPFSAAWNGDASYTPPMATARGLSLCVPIKRTGADDAPDPVILGVSRL